MIYVGAFAPGTNEVEGLYALDPEHNGALFVLKDKQWEQHDERIIEIMPGSGNYVWKLTREQIVNLASELGCPPPP